jgi:hypothetical protein
MAFIAGDCLRLGSPLRVSQLTTFDRDDHRNHEQRLKLIKGRDVDLVSPLAVGDGSMAHGAWAGGERHAVRMARVEENRKLRELQSNDWHERKRACEYFGETATLQNYRALARLVDVLITEKVCAT